MVRKKRLGIVNYAPANFDEDTNLFTVVNFTVCREPDQLRLWYFSGWEDPNPRNPRPRNVMDKFWQTAVAYLAAGLIDRPVCGCDNTREFIKKWQVDISRNGREVSHQTMFSQLGSLFGTTKGGQFAFNKVRMPGRIIGQ